MNTRFNRTPLMITATLAAALLSACGGGGGGDSNSGGGTTPTPVAVTSGNYVAVATEGTATTAQAQNQKSSSLLVGVSTSSRPSWLQFGLDQLPLVEQEFGAPATLAGVTSTHSYQCSKSGSFDMTVTDVNGNNKVDAGDSLVMVYHNCVDTNSSTDGTMAFIFNAAWNGSTSSSAYQIDMTMQFSSVRTVDTSGSHSVDGSLRITSVRTNGAHSGYDSISSPSLNVQEAVAGQTTNNSLTNFKAKATYGSTEVTSTFSSDSITLSSQSGGTVALATVVPFRQRYTDSYPYTGTMTFTGSGTGSASLKALSATQVQLSYDANGDGTYENTAVKSWSSIDW